MIKKSLFIIFLFVSALVNAQKIGAEFITAIDSTEAKHYLIFNRNNTVTVRYPIGPGVHFDCNSYKPMTFGYLIINDTINIKMIEDTSVTPLNCTGKRILNSIFVIKSKNELYDVNSGYVYVNKELADKFIFIVAFENEIYTIRKRGNWAFMKKIKHLNMDEYCANILRGKAAIEKYGICGINGVFELEKK